MSEWQPLLLTARVAGTATAFSVVLGCALGHFLGTHRFPGRRWLMAATVLPLVLPPTVLGYYLLVLVGRRSAFGQAWESLTGSPIVFTTGAAVLAACVSAVPIVTRQMAIAFDAIGTDVLEAGRIDGAGRIGLFLHIQLPLARPMLFSAATIAFARCVGDFGATLMVAGNIPGETRTAALAIYDLMNVGRDAEAFRLVLMVTLLSMLLLGFLAGREEKLT